jgi:hypothetical protein
MQLQLGSIINQGADSVAIVDLGAAGACDPVRFEFMGAHPRLPGAAPRII